MDGAALQEGSVITARECLGWCVIASPIIVLATAMVRAEGWLFSVCVFGAVGLLYGVVALGAWLVFGG